jgi:hypothetical protein
MDTCIETSFSCQARSGWGVTWGSADLALLAHGQGTGEGEIHGNDDA